MAKKNKNMAPKNENMVQRYDTKMIWPPEDLLMYGQNINMAV